jgi:DNA-binding NtrC family response regulator
MSQLPVEIMEPLSTDQQPTPKTVDPAGLTPVASESLEEAVVPLWRFRAQAEITAIQSALKYTGWNRKQAARLLKISYRGLLYKIRRHNITPS